MKPRVVGHRCRVARGAAVLGCLVAVVAAEGAAPEPPPGGPVQLVVHDLSPPAVPRVWRRAVAEALAEMARVRGLDFCLSACLGAAARDPEISWRIEVETGGESRLVVVVMTLALDLRGTEGVPRPEPGLFVLRGQAVLPPGAGALEREGLLAVVLAELVTASEPLAQWLAATAVSRGAHATLDSAPVLEMSPPPPEPPGAADLGDGRGRVVVRVPPSESPTPVTAAGETAEPASQGPPPAAPPPDPATGLSFDVTFRVRVAGEAGGFSRGRSGRLRVFAGGLRFVADGETRSDWSFSWSEIAGVRHAEGLWDVPNPLVVETTAGRRLFVVEVGGDGRFASGARVLAASATAAEESRRVRASRRGAP